MTSPAGKTVIRTPDQRLRVFVSSTLAELADERRAVSDAISALGLTPVLFELGARAHPPDDVYRSYLAQSDIFIGLYWQSYGRVALGMEVSALEEEFDLSRDLPRLLYVKAPAPDRERRLEEMVSRMRQATSYRKFQTTDELGRLVRDDLATLLSERFAAGSDTRPGSADSASSGPRPLPMAATSLIGREQAIEEVAALLEPPAVRLVTLTGAGGVGKTRLAVAVGERLRDRFSAGTAFVPLEAIAEPELVPAAIARAIGADFAGTAPLRGVVERLGQDPWLVILDNLEQALGAAHDIGELLASCPGVKILATSRSALELRAEREYAVAPLGLPPDTATASLDELASSPPVALFLDRARAVRYDFALTAENAPDVVEICRHLDGLPLAIELAAARIRLLEPAELLTRLASSLDAVGTGTADMPPRQRTLRATVEWSVGLLDEGERALVETASVFVEGWTIEAAAEVAGLDEGRTLEFTESLARHSLITLEVGDRGPRLRILDTICAFLRERLLARPDVAAIQRRHAEYFRSLAERADHFLRGILHNEWQERLEVEAGNLAAAVRWYLANDIGPLPDLFQALVLHWELGDHMGEARPWVRQVLEHADDFPPHARAALLWTELATSNEVGDDRAALLARRRLPPLLDEIDDPHLEALSRLALGWTMPIDGDVDGALGGALDALKLFQEQDEPYWAATAGLTVAGLEISAGRYDDARPHLREAGELADRLHYRWVSAWARTQMATVALAAGAQDVARNLLNDGLALSSTVHSLRNVTLVLGAFARLALVSGDPERAALLAGAAQGLRARVGLRSWPMLRPQEDALAIEIRQALGKDRYERLFAAGSQLNQREAIAAAQDEPGGAATSS